MPPGIDPVSLGIQGVQTLGGIVQSIGGLIQAKRAQRGLQNLVSSYKPNQGILDFYNKALQRYNVNPFTSATYQQQTQQAQRGLASGISALNDRRSVVGGIGSLVQGYNDSNLKAAALAEQQQGQALGQLGQASALKAQEERIPFDMQYNLLAMKAQGGNQIMNSGLSNIFGGLSSASDYYTAMRLYGLGRRPSAQGNDFVTSGSGGFNR
jgi:hypothetical protein